MNLISKVHFAIRRHWSRFLFSDRILSWFSDLTDPKELSFFTRDWGGGTIWDVGASVGKYTTILANNNPRSHVVAFEPNFNSLYYLAYRTAKLSNVSIAPNALTSSGQPFIGTYDPDFTAPSTGPMMASLSLREAVAKFGFPVFVKMDIEGGEYELLQCEDAALLADSTILVSWHPQLAKLPIPNLSMWKQTIICKNLGLLEPLKK